MPPISSLMSASSSTMRMSDAMSYSLFLFDRLGGLPRRDLKGGARPLNIRLLDEGVLTIGHWQGPAGRRPFDLAVAFRCIGEMQRSAMLLSNALDDGEPKPRALDASGHIGLDQ